MPFDPLVFLDKYGVTIALLAYFIWKDYHFTERIVSLAARIEDYFDGLEAGKKA
jgi:hypothetical protein